MPDTPEYSASEFRPCPFCGGERVHLLLPTCRPETPYNPADRLYPMVSCCGCSASVDGENEDYRGHTALAAWNHRARAHPEPVERQAPLKIQLPPDIFDAIGERIGRDETGDRPTHLVLDRARNIEIHRAERTWPVESEPDGWGSCIGPVQGLWFVSERKSDSFTAPVWIGSPPSEPRPTEADLDAFVAWLEVMNKEPEPHDRALAILEWCWKRFGEVGDADKS